MKAIEHDLTAEKVRQIITQRPHDWTQKTLIAELDLEVAQITWKAPGYASQGVGRFVGGHNKAEVLAGLPRDQSCVGTSVNEETNQEGLCRSN